MCRPALVTKPKRNLALESLKEIRAAFERSGVTREQIQKAGKGIRKQISRERYGVKR